MAVSAIKATYSLDEETMRALERTAKRWNVSKSEVVRRAIRAIAQAEDGSAVLAALDELQDRVDVDDEAAARWQADSHRERSSYSRRSERGPRSGR